MSLAAPQIRVYFLRATAGGHVACFRKHLVIGAGTESRSDHQMKKSRKRRRYRATRQGGSFPSSTARRFCAASTAMPSRAAMLALPIWGRASTFSRERRG